jgi:hypothetical protein
MPSKERIICVDIYRLDKLISCSTFGEAFKSPHLQRYVSGKLEDEGGIYNILYTYRPFVFGSSVKKPLLIGG